MPIRDVEEIKQILLDSLYRNWEENNTRPFLSEIAKANDLDYDLVHKQAKHLAAEQLIKFLSVDCVELTLKGIRYIKDRAQTEGHIIPLYNEPIPADRKGRENMLAVLDKRLPLLLPGGRDWMLIEAKAKQVESRMDRDDIREDASSAKRRSRWALAISFLSFFVGAAGLFVAI